MKPKVLIMALCSIGIIIGWLHAIYRNKALIKRPGFIIGTLFCLYMSVMSGFASYSFQTENYKGFINILFAFFCLISICLCTVVMLRKDVPKTKTTIGKFMLVIVGGLLFIYIGYNNLYELVYLPYIKHLFN
jgi:hypothetical protein